MLRKDGTHEIYRIQHLDINREKWVGSIENEEFFPASHDCWQTTGIHGTFDMKEGEKALKKCPSKYYRDNRNFRLVKITITQKTEQIELKPTV